MNDVAFPAAAGFGHAVVIGSGMAGLLAARVLADHFERVTLIERDVIPEGPVERKGVPQARHAHLLLAQGYRLLEQLFPGLDAELEAAGAPTVAWPADCALYGKYGWWPRHFTEVVTRACSRTLLEWVIRCRVLANERVELLEGSAVTGLVADAVGTGVAGVRMRRRAVERGDPEEVLAADLVVDASGRSSRAPEWLEALGYDPPEETVIDAFMGYASRWYRCPPGFQDDWKVLVLPGEPPQLPRAGGLYEVEGNRWVVTVSGIAGEAPPTDERDFLEWVRTLVRPDIYEAIREAEPLTPVYGYQRTANRLRHYERLARWPERFVILGEAAYAFNPAYGQGMTVSVVGAMALDKCLREQRRRGPRDAFRGMARAFQRRLAKVNDTPWRIATGQDLRWPTTEGGELNWLERLTHHYMEQVVPLAMVDPSISRTFWEVAHLIRPPASLFHPRIVGRILARQLNPRQLARRILSLRSLAAPASHHEC
ncbi:MAG: 2-polyprenyl-6-methoxyphenol hydroxylase-like oxidoreductase [Chloroflexota bacterium]|nr:2-polyprenyl-6-methoxyphenol hydroxylase-like oxidoreductase [Chloroflexota bacterium]